MKVTKKKVLIALVAVVVLAVLVSIMIPNLALHRATQRLAKQELNTYSGEADKVPASAAIGGFMRASERSAAPVSYDASHKIIRTATLDLVAKDVTQAMEQIKRETVQLGGYVEKSSLNHEGDNVFGNITVRVPQVRLEQAVVEFKQTAIKVQSENIESTDVTKQFVDTESQLRNFRAEEQQYLTIMRTATKVEDTLDIAEKLSDVRGRIESLQGELNYLSNQVEMSSITMTVRPQVTGIAIAFEWHPLANAREAYRDLVAGLATFADFVVGVLIRLPLILLWIAFILAIAFYGWRVGKWGYLKAKALLPAHSRSVQQ